MAGTVSPHFALILWSRRESNPRPNICPISFLHVYFCIDCRETVGAERTSDFLIRFDFHPAHAVGASLSRYLVDWAAGTATGSIPGGHNDYANLWLGSHGVRIFAIWSLSIQIYVLITQRTTCLHTLPYAVKTGRPRFSEGRCSWQHTATFNWTRLIKNWRKGTWKVSG